MKIWLLSLTVASLAGAGPAQEQVHADIRDASVTREGSKLLLAGKPWKAVGGNVYWLGLDENVTPPSGEPFYAPLKARLSHQGAYHRSQWPLSRLWCAVRAPAHTLGVARGTPELDALLRVRSTPEALKQSRLGGVSGSRVRSAVCWYRSTDNL